MARRPDAPGNPLREWRISIMREKVHYLGRVIASGRDAAIDRAMEEFRIEPARLALIVIGTISYWMTRLGRRI